MSGVSKLPGKVGNHLTKVGRLEDTVCMGDLSVRNVRQRVFRVTSDNFPGCTLVTEVKSVKDTGAVSYSG